MFCGKCCCKKKAAMVQQTAPDDCQPPAANSVVVARTATIEPPPRPRYSSSWPTSYHALTKLSYGHLQELMACQEQVWKHMDAKSWNVDLTVGTITWQYDDKVVRATAQLIGTWSEERFLWGWNHPSAPPGTAVAAAAVKGYADRHGITQLQLAQPNVSFEESWQLVSVAALIGDLQGIYRGTVGSHGTWAYIGFGPIAIARNIESLGPIRRNIAPPGRDYSSIDAQEKAQALLQKGELAMIYLMPLMVGGSDNHFNKVFVPPFVVALKDRSDNMLSALFDSGKVSNYQTKVQYDSNTSSVVPRSLLLESMGDGGFTVKESIEIW